MRKQGSLDGIILLVISFSVINYVVSRASACEGRRFFFMRTPVRIKKKLFIHRGKTPGPPPSLRSRVYVAHGIETFYLLKEVRLDTFHQLRLRSMLIRLTIPGEDPRTPSVGFASENIFGSPVGPFAVPTEKKNPRKLTR